MRELLEEVREEHRLNRAAYAQQLDLTRTVVQRNGEAFQGLMAALDRFSERIDAFGERVDAFGERVDAFGATLEIQREILLRFLDRLDEGLPPQG
jgi:hypothetical protein